MSLLDILQGAGHVLDTPGSVVRGLLSGQAGRAFGGIFDPEQRVSGQDMLNSWGIDGGELGGMAAGIATDPLMWGGGALLRMLGRGGEAAATGARAAEGLGAEANAAGKAATEGADKLSNMMNARREFTHVKDVGLDNGVINPGRPVGGYRGLSGGNLSDRMQDLSEGTKAFIEDATASGARGSYRPLDTAAYSPVGATPEVIRHENFHGLMDMAKYTGDTSYLNTLGKTAIAGQNSENPILKALGMAGEEMAAHGAGASGGNFNQLRNMVQFLANPKTGYVEQFSRFNPLVGDLYGSAAIPRLGLAGYGAGAAGGATALASLLGGSE